MLTSLFYRGGKRQMKVNSSLQSTQPVNDGTGVRARLLLVQSAFIWAERVFGKLSRPGSVGHFSRAAWGKLLGHRRERRWEQAAPGASGPFSPACRSYLILGKSEGDWGIEGWWLCLCSLGDRYKSESDSPCRCRLFPLQEHKCCFSCLCIADTRECYYS